MGRIAVDISTDPAALAEALVRVPAMTALALDAWAARVYWQKPTPYSPHFVNHPEEIVTEFVITAYSKPDIDAAMTHVMNALQHMIRPNTIMEHVLDALRGGAAYVAHVYCYPKQHEA